MSDSLCWLDRVGGWTSDEALRTAVSTPGTVAVDLERLDPDAAARVLEQHLAKVFVPSAQTLTILRRLLGAARAHEKVYYADAADYRRGLNALRSPLEPTRPVCLTGPAGVGKSSIARALGRVLSASRCRVEPGRDYGSIDFDEAVRYIRLDANRSGKELLRQVVGAGAAAAGSFASEAESVRWASRWVHRHGVLMILADEWQFVTQSASANALAARLLLLLSFVGVPLCFVSNYSLLHRLTDRPQEEQQRLLSDLIDVVPEGLDDPATRELFDAYRRVSAQALFSSPGALEQQVYDCTFGVTRSAIVLLIHAYRLAREGGRRVVTSGDLERAYRLPAFSCFAEQTRSLMQQAISGRCDRKDLRSPFGAPTTLQTYAQRRAVVQEREAVMQSAVTSSMSPSERKEFGTASTVTFAKPKEPRRPRVTAQALLEGAKLGERSGSRR